MFGENQAIFIYTSIYLTNLNDGLNRSGRSIQPSQFKCGSGPGLAVTFSAPDLPIEEFECAILDSETFPESAKSSGRIA